MGTDNTRCIRVRNIMTLNCGNSEALDALNSTRDEIKNALAQGKDAISTLESKVTEAISQLESVKVPIPSVAAPNLQEDINNVINQATADINQALTELPGKIAEFQETWSDVLSDSEIEGYIDKMQSVVTDAVADPTSLLDFDPCKEFPNKEIKTTTNDLGETVNEAIQKAKTIEIPTINPVEVSESAAPIQTVVVHQEAQPDKQPSAASPSGLSLFDVMKAHSTYSETLRGIKNTYHQGLYDAKEAQITRYEQDNSALEKEIGQKKKQTGKDFATLEKEGAWSEQIIRYADGYDALVDEFDDIDNRIAVLELLQLGYISVITEELELKDFQPTEDSFNSGGKQGNITQGDKDTWTKMKAHIDANKQVVIDYYNYKNRNK